MSIPTQMSLVGFVASAPELHFTKQGAECCRLRVGVEQWRKEVDGTFTKLEPTFHDMVSFESTARETYASASPSAPISWMRDFADARSRLRDWVSICGTRLDRDRPTRQTTWPGELPADAGGEIEIRDRNKDFADFVRQDVLRRRRIEAIANHQLFG